MIRIGKIVAAHGLQGNVIINHIVGKSDWLKKDDVLFVELNKGSFIPYFVTAAKAANEEEYIVGVEEVETVEAAKKLVGKQVYVKDDILSDHSEDSPLMWIGFKLVDKTKGGLGEIKDVMSTGSQWLAALDYEGREVLIPLIEQLILDVNTRNKYIRMDLPEGLLDI